MKLEENESSYVDMNITDNYARFFALGDWGGQHFHPFTTAIQRNISEYITKFSNQNNVHFNLGIGDNFYQLGVQDVNDTRFKVSIVFLHNSLNTKPLIFRIHLKMFICIIILHGIFC